MSAAKTSSWDTSMKWAKMTAAQKCSFLVKNVIAFATFFFVFPNLWESD